MSTVHVRYALNLSRVWQHFQDKNFAVISGYLNDLGPEENRDRHDLLKHAVRELGYGYQEVVGVWKGEQEKSLFVPDISWEDALWLGHGLFDDEHPIAQEAIIASTDDAIYLVDTSDGAEHIIEEFEKIEFNDLKGAWDLYSQIRGRKFRFGEVEWDMAPLPPASPRSWAGALHRERWNPNEGHDYIALPSRKPR